MRQEFKKLPSHGAGMQTHFSIKMTKIIPKVPSTHPIHDQNLQATTTVIFQKCAGFHPFQMIGDMPQRRDKFRSKR